MANNASRLPILFFEGVNTLVHNNVAKREEPIYGENYRSSTVGLIEKRKWFKQIGNDKDEINNLGLFYWPYLSTPTQSFDNDGLFRILRWTNGWSPATNIFYYSLTSKTWEKLWTQTFNVLNEFKSCIIDKDLYLINWWDTSIYISPGGTITSATSNTGNLYNSPVNPYLIEYFKDRIFMAYPVYNWSTEVVSFMVQMSSMPVGILGLIAEDKADIASSSWKIEVQGNTKYFIVGETVEIWRSSTQIGTWLVSTISWDAVTITFTSIGGTPAYIQAWDEFWAPGTHAWIYKYRWATAKSGADVEKYDTFKFTGNDNSRGTMMVNIGNLLMLANKTTLWVWNGSELKKFDLRIGCVSSKANTKVNWLLYFVDYSGVYVTDGTALPKMISSKMDKYIKGMSPAVMETATITTKWLSIFISFRSVWNDKINIYDNEKMLRQSLDYLVLEFDTRNENWYPHTWSNLAFKQVLTSNVIGEIDNFTFTSSIDNKIYEFMPPEELYKDGDKDISFVLETADMQTQSSLESLSDLDKANVEVISWSDIWLYISADKWQMLEIAKLNRGDNLPNIKSWVNGDNLKCSSVKIALKEMSDRPVRIGQCAIIYKPTSQEKVSDNLN